MKNKNIFKNKNRGFFLAELIVAVFVFTVVTTMSMGALIVALDANKKTQSLKSVLNNVNIALDAMARNLSTGEYFYCGVATVTDLEANPYYEHNDCLVGAEETNSITFLSGQDYDEDFDRVGRPGDVFSYSLDQDLGSITRTIYASGGAVIGPIPMTAPEVDITDLRFYVIGSDTANQGDYTQPRVLIVIDGEVPAGPRGESTQFTLQTIVNQRVPDISD